jgi:hypothetical protein
MPVLERDVALDYVVTQVNCEYVAALRPPIDGVLYPSTQSGGNATNVALFSHACDVAPSELPKETRSTVRALRVDDFEHDPRYWSEEDDTVSYMITREVPAPAENPVAARFRAALEEKELGALGRLRTGGELGFGGWKPSGQAIEGMSWPPPTLALVEGKIAVHDVDAIQYTTRVRPVEQLVFPQPETSRNRF